MVVAAQTACEDALRDLEAAATAVTEALKSLIQQIEEGVLLRDRGNLSLSLYMYVSMCTTCTYNIMLIKLAFNPLPLSLCRHL